MGCRDPDAAMIPHNEPEVLTLWSQGWGARHVIWDLEKRQFLYGSGCLPSNNSERRRGPSDQDWSRFWEILDSLGTWDWEGNHAKEFVCDGGDWFLSIRHQGRSLDAHGMEFDKLPHFFDTFERSLNALVGIPRQFRLRAFSVADVSNVERMNDLLSLAAVVQSLRMGSDQVLALVIENIERLENGGQTLLDILSELGPARSALLPALISRLEGDTEATYWNVLALTSFGAEAAAAIPNLLKLLGSTNEWEITRAVSHVLTKLWST